MEITQFLGLALSSLAIIVILHFVVFWVVKTMYPPAAPAAPLPIPVMQVPVPPPTQAPPAFTEPPKVDNVTLPTYETPLPVEAAREEEPRRGPPPPEETSIRRKPGVDAPNA